jgi:mutator protein MutT
MNEKNYKNPTPTVDAIIQDKDNRILLIKRKNDPFKDHLALPGGFVDYGETVEDSIKREIKEETSLTIEPIEILGVYSNPKRDPRGHIMSTVFICLNLEDNPAKAGDDAKQLCWIDLEYVSSNQLAFDHNIIIDDYKHWRKNNSTYWSNKKR